MGLYKKQETEISYDQPIMAIGEDVKGSKVTCILLPVRDANGHLFGYNWFNLVKGDFNSDIGWSTVDKAIEAYEQYYTIVNAKLQIPEV